MWQFWIANRRSLHKLYKYEKRLLLRCINHGHALFSAPEPEGSSVLNIVVMRRPSSVVVNLSLFRLLLLNRSKEFNETWQEASSQRSIPILCFSGWLQKQYSHPGLWWAETFSNSPLKPLKGIQRNLTGSKISMSSTKFVFSGRSEKQYGRPGLWLAETFSTSPLKLLNGIQRNLTGSNISMSSTNFVFFGPIWKTRLPPWLLIGWDIFDFLLWGR